ncbi:hypothetical protein JHK87_018446 [Glycine soja]|nr:hypothetical protein JHK87_018446 [Glycine soja]
MTTKYALSSIKRDEIHQGKHGCFFGISCWCFCFGFSEEFNQQFQWCSFENLGEGKVGFEEEDFTVAAKLRKVKKHEYLWPANPDPNVKGEVLSHLSQFKPLKEKPKPVTLDFEKPLVDLQKKIIDVRKMANETGQDFSDQILLLETKYQQSRGMCSNLVEDR